MSHVTAEYLIEQGLSKTFPQRFFSKIQFTDSCWLWTGYKMPNGYGQINRKEPGTMMLAHRASWVLHFGPIPEGQNVLHDCPDGDCRWCVCPAHLWIGTYLDNNRDTISKGRWKGGSNPNPRFGERHPSTSLKWEQVCKMRELWDARSETQHGIARLFGVHVMTVNAIVRRQRWNRPY